jgi:hypothetical protein
LAHIRIVLKVDEGLGGPAWRDEEIARALDVSVAMIERVRRRFIAEGLEGGGQPQAPESTVRPCAGR